MGTRSPAAASTGVVGAQAIGRLAGFEDLITFDMGGTSTDVCLVQDGRPSLASESEIDGLPIRTPVLEKTDLFVRSIGAMTDIVEKTAPAIGLGMAELILDAAGKVVTIKQMKPLDESVVSSEPSGDWDATATRWPSLGKLNDTLTGSFALSGSLKS